MLLGDGLPDSKNDLIEAYYAVCDFELPVQLVRDDQPFYFVNFHRESCSTASSQCPMRVLYREFYVGRMMITPSDKDEILQPSANEQLLLVDKAKISCSQIRTFHAVRYVSCEDLCRLRFSIPIAGSYTRT